jgi:protein O-GlcNAc transferase
MGRSKSLQHLLDRKDEHLAEDIVSAQTQTKQSRLKSFVMEQGNLQILIPRDLLPQSFLRADAAIRKGQAAEAVYILNSQALQAVREILQHDPCRTDIMFLFAMLLRQTRQFDRAKQWYEKILQQEPNALVYNELGYTCQCTAQMWQALQYQKKAVQAEPEKPEFQANLARILMELGRTQEGIELLRKAVAKMPANAQVHSNLLFRLHHLPQLEPQVLFDEHRRWGQVHAPISRARVSYHNAPDPDRRLRVGYISPDFRSNSVVYFFESLLDGHNRQAVDVYGYGNVEFPDQVTESLTDKFDCYRNICGVRDEAVAELIEQDKIDILVDLAGHTADNRLLVLAYKPAPIQVSYLGYPDTTGMEAVDYRLTDVLADPPESQKFYTEELVYLPDGFLCYRPADFAPSVAPLPSAKNGYITFGSFNNNSKINPFITALWAEVLKASSGSRLLLKLKGGSDRQLNNHYISQFEQSGIARDRLTIQGWKSPAEHLQLYGEVDIALDSFPYNGTTTTCEALWMGVPTISLVGTCHVSRVGLSILSRVGLGFFAASTPAEYVAKATALAANPQSLAKIRSSLRARAATSGLCCAKLFSREVESAYRKMWHRWCLSRNTKCRG